MNHDECLENDLQLQTTEENLQTWNYGRKERCTNIPRRNLLFHFHSDSRLQFIFSDWKGRVIIRVYTFDV